MRGSMSLMKISRRTLLAGIPATVMLGCTNKQTPTRPRIAAVVTEYRKWSHAEHMVDRFLYGYGWESQHHRPAMDLVSLYVDQVKENDLSRERVRSFPATKMYPTIAEALTLGGSQLAVDGVLLIGEH